MSMYTKPMPYKDFIEMMGEPTEETKQRINTVVNKRAELANTIINQMGGWRKLQGLAGAHDMLALDAGVQFSFKGSKIANKMTIELTPMGLYDVKFYKISMKYIERNMIPVKEIEGVYNEMLVDIFESSTRLDIHWGD